MRFLYFFISHSIFISFCAVGLCYETFILLHLPVIFTVLGFVFFSTLCSYNFYWLLSKFYFKQSPFNFLQNNISNITMLLFGGAGSLYFFICSSINLGYLYISILLTLLYSMPLWPFSFTKKMQHLGFAKTILLAFAWAFVTVMLPLSNATMLWNETIALFVIRFLFMLMLCIIFDKRDVVVDKIHGLQTLVTKMDVKKIGFLYYVLLLGYIVFSIYFLRNNPFIHVLQVLMMSTILGFAYRKSLQPRGYLFYYFFIDGIMLVSLLATLITQIKLL
jgi:4-hydroxybenzoate polyprenyltransferase